MTTKNTTVIKHALRALARRGFVVGELIGEGTFGAVYVATNTTKYRDKPLAIKLVTDDRIYTSGIDYKTLAEIAIGRGIESPFITPVLEVLFLDESGSDRGTAPEKKTTATTTIASTATSASPIPDITSSPDAFAVIALVMPKADSSLTGFIEQHKSWTLAANSSSTSSSVASLRVAFATHIACGLKLLHSYGYVHGDIKPDNVLLFGNVAKLADFGLAQLLQGAHDLIPSWQLYSAWWNPPENLARTMDVAPASDWWAYGVMMRSLLFAANPFIPMAPVDVRVNFGEESRKPYAILHCIGRHLGGLTRKLEEQIVRADYREQQQQQLDRDSKSRDVASSTTTTIRRSSVNFYAELRSHHLNFSDPFFERVPAEQDARFRVWFEQFFFGLGSEHPSRQLDEVTKQLASRASQLACSFRAWLRLFAAETWLPYPNVTPTASSAIGMDVARSVDPANDQLFAEIAHAVEAINKQREREAKPTQYAFYQQYYTPLVADALCHLMFDLLKVNPEDRVLHGSYLGLGIVNFVREAPLVWEALNKLNEYFVYAAAASIAASGGLRTTAIDETQTTTTMASAFLDPLNGPRHALTNAFWQDVTHFADNSEEQKEENPKQKQQGRVPVRVSEENRVDLKPDTADAREKITAPAVSSIVLTRIGTATATTTTKPMAIPTSTTITTATIAATDTLAIHSSRSAFAGAAMRLASTWPDTFISSRSEAVALEVVHKLEEIQSRLRKLRQRQLAGDTTAADYDAEQLLCIYSNPDARRLAQAPALAYPGALGTTRGLAYALSAACAANPRACTIAPRTPADTDNKQLTNAVARRIAAKLTQEPRNIIDSSARVYGDTADVALPTEVTLAPDVISRSERVLLKAIDFNPFGISGLIQKS